MPFVYLWHCLEHGNSGAWPGSWPGSFDEAALAEALQSTPSLLGVALLWLD